MCPKPFLCGAGECRPRTTADRSFCHRDVDELRHDEETLRQFEAEPSESTVHGKEVRRESVP